MKHSFLPNHASAGSGGIALADRVKLRGISLPPWRATAQEQCSGARRRRRRYPACRQSWLGYGEGVRLSLALLLALAVAPGTWLRTEPPPPSYAQRVTFTPIPLPPRPVLKANLGPFELAGVWRVDSPHADFGSFSALIRTGAGQFIAFSDKGHALRFSAPGMDQRDTRITPIAMMDSLKATRDAEGGTYDQQTGRSWIAWETRNAISRLSPELEQEAIVRPRAMRDWGVNSGPETLLRLADGRFIALREGFNGRFETQRHKAVIFAGDPIESGEPEHFTFVGPARFAPTDAAQLSDGRVLILLRRLVWLMPFRFAGRIALAHPDDIRPDGTWEAHEVAKLTSGLPVDNFEGMAIEPGPGSNATVWLISDDNDAATQSTLLWKLVVDPAELH